MPRSCVRTSDSIVSYGKHDSIKMRSIQLIIVSLLYLQLLYLQLDLDGLALQCLDRRAHLDGSVPLHDQFVPKWYWGLILFGRQINRIPTISKHLAGCAWA